MAGDGVAALALFGGQTFDLVLLDLMLPKIDGFGVCELIRQQSQVPILMLTALDGEESQLRGFGMDIDDYNSNGDITLGFEASASEIYPLSEFNLKEWEIAAK